MTFLPTLRPSPATFRRYQPAVEEPPPPEPGAFTVPRLHHAYNPPGTFAATGAMVAGRYDFLSYNNDEHAYVNSLRSTYGWPGEASQYILATQISSNAVYYKNNIGGVYRDAPTWAETDYLHNSSGARLYESQYQGIQVWQMDLMSTAFRNWFFPRCVTLLNASYGDWLFLDNVDLSMHRLESSHVNGTPTTQEYTVDANYRADVLNYTAAICQYIHSAIPGSKIIGNLTSSFGSEADFQPYLASGMLDGALYEYFVGRWDNLLTSNAFWEQQLRQIEWGTDRSKTMIAVCQGTEFDTNRFRFGYASFLLICSPYTVFSYANSSGGYGQTWDFPEYSYDLGQPTNVRYRPSPVSSPYLWRRDFENGYATANGATQVGTITLT